MRHICAAETLAGTSRSNIGGDDSLTPYVATRNFTIPPRRNVAHNGQRC
jgi:hypothetical protein